MKKIQQVLCLVLAMVFVLGLCTIGAGAAELTDAADVNPAYKNAITVMNGLGIIEGFPDGSFKPADNVTREQAAKLVAYMLLGSKNAEKLPAGDGGFSDVDAGRWSAKYINYCSSKGYIKGLGDGTFNPTGNIKGTELATLLLRVAGYGVMGEYEGKGWDINAVSDALAKGVFDDAETADFNVAATREETALYFFNTLTDVVRVSYDVDLNDYITTGVNAGSTFGADVWKLHSVIDQVEGNQATGEEYTTLVNGAVWVYGSGSSTYTIPYHNFKIDTALSLVGHQVKIWYRFDVKTDDKNQDYLDAYLVEDLSTEVILSEGMTSAKYGEVYAALHKANSSVNDSKNISSVPVWENYALTGSTLSLGASLSTPATTFRDLRGLNANSVSGAPFGTDTTGKLILDRTGAVLCAMKTTSSVDKVEKISDVIKLKVSGDEVELEDGYEGIKEGDFVYVTAIGSKGKYQVQPTTTDTVDITSLGTSPFITVNNAFLGGDYFTMWNQVKNSVFFYPPYSTADALKIGDTVTLYKDPTGSVFAIGDRKLGSSAGYVYVTVDWTDSSSVLDEFGDPIGARHIQCVNEEGKDIVYTLTGTASIKSASGAAFSGSTANHVFEITLNSAGKVTNMIQVANSEQTKQNGVYSSLRDTMGNTYFIDGKTTNIYYIDGIKGDIDVSKSGKMPDTTSGSSYTVYIAPVSSGTGTYNVTTVWVKLGGGVTGDVEYTGGYIYVVDDDTGVQPSAGHMDYNGKDTYYYSNVYVDGEASQYGYFIKGSPVNADKSIPAGFYAYDVEDGVYTISAFTNTTKIKKISTTWGASNLYNGKLYDLTSGQIADGVNVSSLKVVVTKTPSGFKNKAETDYLKIETIADLEELLAQGYRFDVSYMAAKSGANWVPKTVIYVTACDASLVP